MSQVYLELDNVTIVFPTKMSLVSLKWKLAKLIQTDNLELEPMIKPWE